MHAVSVTERLGLLQIGIAIVVADDFDVQALLPALKLEFGPAAPMLVARIESVPRTATGKPSAANWPSDI